MAAIVGHGLNSQIFCSIRRHFRIFSGSLHDICPSQAQGAVVAAAHGGTDWKRGLGHDDNDDESVGCIASMML
jgi:hypothetical protein